MEDAVLVAIASFVVPLAVDAAALGRDVAAEFIARQPVGAGMLAFLLLYGVLTLAVRFVDRIDPPRRPERRARPGIPAEPARKIWRYRKAA